MLCVAEMRRESVISAVTHRALAESLAI